VGTEDYVGSAWSLGPYAHQYQGCPIADTLHHQWAFYRYHILDAVYFRQDCRVTIQQLGMASTDQVRQLVSQGARLLPVGVLTKGQQLNLLDQLTVPALTAPEFP
jgi:hypothetical protein